MSAPIGNKNALGNDGGRPPFFNEPHELEEMISGYFRGGAEERTIFINGIEKEIPVYTITGLAIYLGFASKQSLYDYQNKIEFTYLIKKARSFIERVYEENLQIGSNTTGAIFALKNMGWKDKTEVETKDTTIRVKDV